MTNGLIIESFWDSVDRDVISLDNTIEDEYREYYEMNIRFEPKMGSRELRMFLTDVPFENIFNRFIGVVDQMSYILGTELKMKIIFNNNTEYFTDEFTKGSIYDYIMNTKDEMIKGRQKLHKFCVEFSLKFIIHKSLLQSKFISDMRLLENWRRQTFEALRTIDSSQGRYYRCHITISYDNKDIFSEYINNIVCNDIYKLIYKMISNDENDVEEDIADENDNIDVYGEFYRNVLNDCSFDYDIIERKQVAQGVFDTLNHVLAKITLDEDTLTSDIADEIIDNVKSKLNRKNKIRMSDYGHYDVKQIYFFIMCDEHLVYSEERNLYIYYTSVNEKQPERNQLIFHVVFVDENYKDINGESYKRFTRVTETQC